MRDWAAEIRSRLSQDRAPAVPRETLDEIAQHVADVHRAALLQGASTAEANDRVERELEHLADLAADVARRRRGRVDSPPSPGGMAGLTRDIAHAWRLLRSRRGYAVVAVLTLGVGIAGCAAVFSLFDALLLRPLPYPNPERLVLLWETDADNQNAYYAVAQPNYEDWRRETKSFVEMGYWQLRTYNVASATEPEQVTGARASASLFDVLAVPPALGRTFSVEEEAPGHDVAIISDGVWRTHFGADRQAIGRTLQLNGVPHEVIGVMPAGFEFPRKGTGIWTPVALTARDRAREMHSFNVAGRLRHDATFEQARDEVQRLGEALRQMHEENDGEGASIQRMSEHGVLNVRRTLTSLSLAVALVLVIAIANVASLQFALGLSRRREFVTRLALGASARRLARQVFVEALLVAAAGCAMGIAGAWALTRSADLLLSPGFPDVPMRGQATLGLNVTVVLLAAGVSLISSLCFAFAPLLGLRGSGLQPSLRDGERGATRMAERTRRVLVSAEIALAVVVLSSAGLMVRSLTALLDVPPGLDPRNVLTLSVALPQPGAYGPPERRTFCADLNREVGAVPGVLRVSATSHLPLNGLNAGRNYTIEGRPPVKPHEGPSANYRLLCPGYFATLAIPILAGRDFLDADGRDSEPVVIVNRSSAERRWPGEDPLGQRIKLGDYGSSEPWMKIVGVVEDVKHFGLEADVREEIYFPYSQTSWPVMTVLAKTAAAPMTFERSVRAALRRVEADLPAANARSMEDVVARSVAWQATPMRLLSGFAIVGLLLAGVGLYGVLAYYVSQRTREFGVRVALGASKASLIVMILRQSAVPVAAGLAIGMGGSLAASRLLAEVLFQVRPGDPLVLAAIGGLVATAALMSGIVPARRATRVDPVVALREE